MQALIVAHTESSELRQLTSSRSTTLLPLGHETILSRLIKTLVDSGISDIMITHTEDQANALMNYIEMNKHLWPSNLLISFCEMPTSSGATSESVHRIRAFLNSDYLFVINSSTVLTNLDLRELFATMVRNKASMVAVFSPLPTTKTKFLKNLPRELVLTDGDGTALLHYFAASDIKKHSQIPKTLLALNQRILCRSDLRDSGIFLLFKSMMDAVIPVRLDAANDAEDQLTKAMASLYVTRSEVSGACIYEHKDSIVCLKLDDPLVYGEIHRLILNHLENVQPSNKSTKTKDTPKDTSCIVAGVNLDPTVTVRGSYIGSKCSVGAHTLIQNSILLTEATVHENCKIDNCVVGEKVIIEDGCQLKNCVIAAFQRVPTGTCLESEQLGFTDLELELAVKPT